MWPGITHYFFKSHLMWNEALDFGTLTLMSDVKLLHNICVIFLKPINSQGTYTIPLATAVMYSIH